MKNSDGPASCTPGIPPGDSEAHRIKAIRQGDETAFRAVFEEYYEPLLCFSFRYVQSGDHAEGVVQDLFLWIWENREEWYVEGSLKTYLFRAAKYRCLDLLRHEEVRRNYIREERRRREDEVDALAAGEADIDRETFEKQAKKAIEELPERAKMVYKLSRLEGLTYTEIAEVLDISPKTVESQMSRAFHILRTRLSKYISLFIVIRKLTDSLF